MMMLNHKIQHSLSRLAGTIAHCSKPNFLRKAILKIAVKKLDINLDEAEKNHLDQYKNLNDLFTRKLKNNARPIAPPPSITAPVDGTLLDFGTIKKDQTFNVKNHDYTLESLFGPHAELAQTFAHGNHASFYLAPHNYHRVHCPTQACLTHMLAIPGQLFSVNLSSNKVPQNVFAKNERVVALFNVKGGQMAVVFVGAMLVGSIHTSWTGQVTPPTQKPAVAQHHYQPNQFTFESGSELGHFQFGSSIVVLFSPNTVRWDKNMTVNKPVLMGEAIGAIIEENR